jgi:signal transduction histidine kinase
VSSRTQAWLYVAALAACVAIVWTASWTSIGKGWNRIPFDTAKTVEVPAAAVPESKAVVVAIDEPTLKAEGGMYAIRSILAAVLNKVNAAQPAAVADDILLADPTPDESGNAALESALRSTHKLILPCDVILVDGSPRWELPLPRFAQYTTRFGHVRRDESGDLNHYAHLREVIQNDQKWALALETYSAVTGQPIVESPEDVQVGDIHIPAKGVEEEMWIRYVPGSVPVISALAIDQNRDRLRGQAVFVGVTATGAGDQQATPLGEMPGVLLHAYIYESIARGPFFTPVRNDIELLVSVLFAAAAGLVFKFRSGWQAYALAVLLLALSVWTPFEFFHFNRIFPFFEPIGVAWLSLASAATFQYFFVTRQLRKSESERSRYQQALHWAAHEMRTPLTAIQGSSEIMTRYQLPDAKRHELSAMINSESKRLARMIQTFLDVERLADGQMEMKREPFAMADVVETCLQRAEPIAERKKTRLFLDSTVDGNVNGDRELMEYALYNLLTNAVKYSPPETEVHVSAVLRGGELSLSVRDQGIGMDEKELKNIFKKFYRTKRAEASGEKGTGIGLSIVEQIVTHHGGRMEVASEPGRGSCFTMIVAAAVSAAVSPNAETSDRRG